jgi:hypothetical protein
MSNTEIDPPASNLAGKNGEAPDGTCTRWAPPPPDGWQDPRPKDNERLYVDLLGAIRVVVRLMPDGGSLADIMTDSWITDPFSSTASTRRDTDPNMLRQYGNDWPALRMRVVTAYGRACKIVQDVLPKGNVRGWGRSIGERVPRAITSAEWGREPNGVHIDLERNRLLALFGKSERDFPEVLVTSVSVEDLGRECTTVKIADTPKNKGGAPTVVDWPPIRARLKDRIREDGFPYRDGEPGWRYQADVIRFIEDLTRDVHPVWSTLKGHARLWLKEIRSELEAEKTDKKSKT